jgi:hypothetical protein
VVKYNRAEFRVLPEQARESRRETSAAFSCLLVNMRDRVAQQTVGSGHRRRNVCFWHKADMAIALHDVRFWR